MREGMSAQPLQSIGAAGIGRDSFSSGVSNPCIADASAMVESLLCLPRGPGRQGSVLSGRQVSWGGISRVGVGGYTWL